MRGVLTVNRPASGALKVICAWSSRDHGPVIAKGQLQEIFNPFRKLDPGREESVDLRSVGLGLYIAQSIVKAHHGTIEVESSEAGTTFTVTLPRGVPPM